MINAAAWPPVSLGEVLSQSNRQVPVEAGREYPNFGVYSFGRGLFSKRPINGARSSATTLYQATENQFVYSRLFAFEGAYGLVGREMDGAFVSNEFPLFNCDRTRLLPEYLGWLFRYPRIWSDIAQLTTGMGNRRQRVKPEALLKYSVLLPPLHEQRRLVARLECLSTKVAEASELKRQAANVQQVMFAHSLSALIEGLDAPRHALGALLREKSRNGLSTAPRNGPPGHRILRISAGTSRGDGLVNEMDFKFVDAGEREVAEFTLEPNDLLACRFNGNLRFVGKFSLFKGYTGERLLHPDKLIRFRVEEKLVLPEFVREAMNSSVGRTGIEAFCQTTAGNIGISAKNLNTVKIPVPSLDKQQQVVDRANRLRTRATEVTTMNDSFQIACDALLPSIFDRAFKGAM